MQSEEGRDFGVERIETFIWIREIPFHPCQCRIGKLALEQNEEEKCELSNSLSLIDPGIR